MANLSFTVFLSQIKYFKKHPFIISDTVQLICVNQMLILLSTRQRSRICDVLVDTSGASLFRRCSPLHQRHVNFASTSMSSPIDHDVIIEINGISYIRNFDKA